jgi:hypothetical protein
VTHEPPPPQIAARSARNPEVYTRDDPPLFMPYGEPVSERPKKRDCEDFRKSHEPLADLRAVFRDEEVETAECIVWRNGISLRGKFYPLARGRKCKKALKQIQENQLPTTLAQDLEGCQLELIFRKHMDYPGEESRDGA